ncbi:MAG: hypothetical protein NXH97_23080 [Rhodobacteraceae bacterium]|nr:hypothetical protein [Paracoccaceae bacterium]
MARKGFFSAPGPLSVLTLLLVVSGMLRLASGPVVALATDAELAAAGEPSEATAQRTPDQDMDQWIGELMSRDDALARAEIDIAQEREELALAKQVLAEQLAALQNAQETLRRSLHAAGETAAGDVSQLTEVYQRMKPKEAAAIFEEMDPNFAAGFLARMKPDAAAQVMAGLQPTTAYTFSAILAGRNAALSDVAPNIHEAEPQN